MSSAAWQEIRVGMTKEGESCPWGFHSLLFVIPSEAEGSAVRLSVVPNLQAT
jgi:hypothetical protein